MHWDGSPVCLADEPGGKNAAEPWYQSSAAMEAQGIEPWSE
jgi:hypothetical protein